MVAAITFACGGKTGLLEENGTGGSSGGSGQGGRGSTGASGATGRGGSAGGGGTTGISGAAGVSGAGGSGGVSGSAGVAGTGVGGAGGTTEQLIDAICTNFEKFGCGNLTCQQALKQSVDFYDLRGCGDEWLQDQACTLRDPRPCTQYCMEFQSSFQRCITEDEDGTIYLGNDSGQVLRIRPT